VADMGVGDTIVGIMRLAVVGPTVENATLVSICIWSTCLTSFLGWSGCNYACSQYGSYLLSCLSSSPGGMGRWIKYYEVKKEQSKKGSAGELWRSKELTQNTWGDISRICCDKGSVN
jgi:hypothetical protein